MRHKVIAVLKQNDYTLNYHYYVNPAGDEVIPLMETDGPIMADILGAAKLHPKAEVYYNAADNRVYICGYAR